MDSFIIIIIIVIIIMLTRPYASYAVRYSKVTYLPI